MSENDQDALRVLTRRSTATSGWLAPDVVRRVAVRRRRRGYGIGAAVVVAALVAVLVPALTSGGPSGPSRQSVAVAHGLRVASRLDGAQELVAAVAPVTSTSSTDVTKVADADTAFGLKLLQQLLPPGGSNVSVSPASLSLALAMLQNGAAGDTQAQILSAMQSADLSPSALDAGWAALAAEWSQAAADGGLTLTSANSVWVQAGLTPGAAFMATLGRYFRSGEWQVDFAHDLGGATRAINDWVAQHTNKRITQLFARLDPQTLLVLANAVYFDARWSLPFDPHDTQSGSFTTSAGATDQVPFMDSGHESTFASAVTTSYDAVELPYRGGRFAALAVMPKGQSLAAFTRGLTSRELDSISSSLTEQRTDVRMPKFTTTSTLDLPAALQALGMTTAFTDRADFAPMSPRVPLKVGQAVQKVYLRVAEKGTEAAAATGVVMVPTMGTVGGVSISLDHPFLFLVRDVRTGAVLFESAIQDPRG